MGPVIFFVRVHYIIDGVPAIEKTDNESVVSWLYNYYIKLDLWITSVNAISKI